MGVTGVSFGTAARVATHSTADLLELLVRSDVSGSAVLGVVASHLDLVARELGVENVVVAIDDRRLGRQVFTSGRRPLGDDGRALTGAADAFTDPPLDLDPIDRRLLVAAVSLAVQRVATGEPCDPLGAERAALESVPAVAPDRTEVPATGDDRAFDIGPPATESTVLDRGHPAEPSRPEPATRLDVVEPCVDEHAVETEPEPLPVRLTRHASRAAEARSCFTLVVMRFDDSGSSGVGGAVISDVLGPCDEVIRLGDDRLALVLADCAAAEAHTRLESMSRSDRLPRCAVGMAQWPDDARSANGLLAHAARGVARAETVRADSECGGKRSRRRFRR